MRLPAALHDILTGVTAIEPVGGGCISPAARVRTTSGDYFVKWSSSPGAIFACEAKALRVLGAAHAVRTPEVIAVAPQFIVLEWLPPAQPGRQTWAAFGQQLAALHRVSCAQFGWDEPNFIGSLPQSNEFTGGWPQFWREQRLERQLRLALQRGTMAKGDAADFERLYSQLDELLASGQSEGPALLHGDLWNGNVQPTAGTIALIDPSSYYGHREVDLAMADLFGGFPTAFWEGYQEAWPLPAGATLRRAVYQLYYLLVHVNLFGGGYVQQTRGVLARLLRS